MKIVVAGASGLIGSALVPALEAAGHEVVRLSRHPGAGNAVWEPAAGRLDPAVIEGAGAVINLAGAGIADHRWTASRRAEIIDSRVAATRLLVDTIGKVSDRPAVLVSASGAGFYGDGGERELDEESPSGEGFLTTVCLRWEAEARRAEGLEVRVVFVRLGMVLASNGGALARMLPIFRSGLGGPVGTGRQWVSWISIDDAVAAFLHLVSHGSIAGPVNAVAPGAVRQVDFAAVLGRVLHRPTVARAPAVMLRLMFGKMAEETVLVSARVVPARLRGGGFTFQHDELEGALRHVLRP